MIYSIVSLNDIFYTENSVDNGVRSSNPYDYIRDGYYLDNVMFGGENDVNFNSNISSHRTSTVLDIANKRKRSQCNIS